MRSSLVLDAGAFYAGTAFLSSAGEQEERQLLLYTTPAVFEEIRHIKASFSALEALQESGKLAIRDPGQGQLDEVVRTARITGDIGILSEADKSIIALALQLKAQLVTDDYSAANVASALQIAVKPATAGKGIKEVRRWIFYCAGCSRTFGPGKAECPYCGNRLRRKYKKVRPL